MLAMFVDQAPVAIAMLDRDLRYIAASRRYLRDYGLANGVPRGQSHYELFPDLPQRWRDVHRRALAGEVVSASDDRYDHPDGTVHWLHWEVRPWNDADAIGGIMIFAEDVTERRRADERFRVVVESNPNANVLVDETDRIVLVNRQAELLFGYDRSEMLGRSVGMLVPLHLQAAHNGHCLGFLEQPSRRPMGAGRDLYGVRKDGTVVPVEIGLAPISTEQGRLVLALVIDITERKASEARMLGLNAELERRVQERTAQLQRSVGDLRVALEEAERLRRELREQSIRDALTGLFNRRFLEETLRLEVPRASRNATPLSVVMLDMDKFKVINDTLGHAAGDSVLREIGHIILESLRAEDVPCRFGGDEFVILMPGTLPHDAMNKAEALRARMRGVRVRWNGGELPGFDVSVGVASLPEDGLTGEAILAAADAALYAAKDAGGGRTAASPAAVNGDAALPLPSSG